jgi:WD40 repeat protein
MRTQLEIALSILIIATSFCFSHCGLSGATRDKLLQTIPVSSNINLAAFSPDGETLAVVDRTDLSLGKYAVKFIRTSDGRINYSTENYPIYGVAFSPDGSLLAASCGDGVRVFRSADGQLLRSIEGNQLFSVAFSPNGETLASGGALGEVEVWRVSNGTLLQKHSVGKWITSLAFSPNGELLAVGTSANIGFVRKQEASNEDNPIFLWYVNGSQQLTTLAGHKYGVSTLAFSHDGKLLASGGSEGLIKLWRPREKVLIKSYEIRVDSAATENREPEINYLAFAPDNESLAVACDNQIVLLQSKDLSTLFTLKGHTSAVVRLHFSRDGSKLTSASEDKTIRLWRIS